MLALLSLLAYQAAADSGLAKCYKTQPAKGMEVPNCTPNPPPPPMSLCRLCPMRMELVYDGAF